jgi:hypothetical protein
MAFAQTMKYIGIGIAVLLVTMYVVFYFESRQYLNEPFVSAPNNEQTRYTKKEDLNREPNLDVEIERVEVPYETAPISDLGDYEYNLVYQNESDTALTKELRDKLMSQYPMHWTTYPPSSSQFQIGNRESFQNPRPNVPDDAAPYQNITGATMQPPDSGAVEREERKILQTYVPKFPPSPTEYDKADVEDLIKKIYDAKGMVPEFKQRDGTNIYEVISTRKKDEKIVYEDEVAGTAPVQGKKPVAEAMEQTVVPPTGAKDLVSSNKDSFFEEGTPKSKLGKMNQWDYTAFTPGLERMFAPTEPRQNWY